MAANPHEFTENTALDDADEVYGQNAPFGPGSEYRITLGNLWANVLKPKADEIYATSSVETLAELSDVSVAAPGDGDLLVYQSGFFQNLELAGAGIAAASHNHDAGDITSGTLEDARIAQSSITQHQAALRLEIDSINGLQSALDAKAAAVHGHNVSEIAGTVAFTQAEKDKLAGLDGSLFLGAYTDLTALQTAHPTASIGQYAHVDSGVGDTVRVYIWDESDSAFVEQAGSGTSETPASVLTKLLANPDVNVVTDAQKAALDDLGGFVRNSVINMLVAGENVTLTTQGDQLVISAAADAQPLIPAATISDTPPSEAGMARFFLTAGFGAADIDFETDWSQWGN